MSKASIKIINNFLPDEVFKKVQDFHFSVNFPWYLQNGVNTFNDGHHQFMHTFYVENKVNSDDFKIIEPVIEKLKVKKLIRAKSNLLCRTKKIIEHGFHIDFSSKDIRTAIFYLNNTNGYTLFKNRKIPTIANTMVHFKCTIPHSGSTCTNVPFRVVLNINYIPK